MRRRLVALAVSAAVAALVLFALPLAVTLKLLVEQRVFDEAELRARVVAAVLDETAERARADDAVHRVVDDDGPPFAVIFDGEPDDGAVVTSAEMERARQALAEARGRAGLGHARLRVRGATLFVEAFGAGSAGSAPRVGSGLVVVRVPESLVTHDLDPWWWAIGAAAVGLFLCSAGVANHMARSIVRPLRRLAAAAERVRRGELGARVAPVGPPEIALLGAAFNRMVARIGWLLACEAERLSDLSHRLRTPVTALHLEAEALANRPERERMVARVVRMGRAIDDVIDETRRRVGADQREASDLREVAVDRLAFWEPLFAEQGRALELVGADQPAELVVPVPAAELASLVDELVANTVQHAGGGAGVRIELRQGEDGEVLLEVSDSGTGIHDPRVLRRGFSTSRSSGLGLDIVRRVAEQAGGSLRVGRSRQGGASVTVSFAVAEEPATIR